MGINDLFGQSGTPDELLEYYGLSVDGIVANTHRLLSKK
jgi:transketolase